MSRDSSDLETSSAPAAPATPWYKPDTGTLAGARRAILPGLWLAAGYGVFLVVQFIYQRFFSPVELVDYDAANILVVMPVFTAILILFAYRASRIACGLLVMSGIATTRQGVDLLLANEMLTGLGLTVAGLALTVLCAIGFLAAWRYHAGAAPGPASSA